MVQKLQLAERDIESHDYSSFPRNDNIDIFKLKKSEAVSGSLIFGAAGYIVTDIICHAEKFFKVHPGFWRGNFIGVVATVGISALYSCRMNRDYQLFQEETTHPRWLCMGGAAVASLGGACFSAGARFLFGQDLMAMDMIAGVIGSIVVGVLVGRSVNRLINSSSPETQPIENRSRKNNFEVNELSHVLV